MNYCTALQTDRLSMLQTCTQIGDWECADVNLVEMRQLHNNSYFCFSATYRLTLLDSKINICSCKLPCSDIWLFSSGALRQVSNSCTTSVGKFASGTGFFSRAKSFLWLKWPKCGREHHNAWAMGRTGNELQFSFVLMVAAFDHLDELQVFLNSLRHHEVCKKSHWATDALHYMAILKTAE